MAKLIKANGEIIDVFPKNGSDFKLEELREFVGGYIEVVLLDNGQWMVVNEEGKFDGLPPNFYATELLRMECERLSGDIIVGNALVCDKNQIR